MFAAAKNQINSAMPESVSQSLQKFNEAFADPDRGPTSLLHCMTHPPGVWLSSASLAAIPLVLVFAQMIYHARFESLYACHGV